jgi:hypothetical protein
MFFRVSRVCAFSRTRALHTLLETHSAAEMSELAVQFRANGAIQVKRAIPPELLARLTRAVDENIAKPVRDTAQR